MISFTKIAVSTIIGLSVSLSAFAALESASLIEEIPSTKGIYKTCVYESTTGYRFSIQRTLCPIIAYIDTETGMVKKF